MTGLRLGIDLGGTKIEIAALAADGAFVLRERALTPQGDYAATLHAIAGLVTQAEQRFRNPAATVRLTVLFRRLPAPENSANSFHIGMFF